jgi:hypothetical protein
MSDTQGNIQNEQYVATNKFRVFLDQEQHDLITQIRSKDFYERIQSVGGDIALNEKKGYYFNYDNIEYGIIPKESLVIEPLYAAIKFPSNLRFGIFEKAPNLPYKYKENMEYWGGKVDYPKDFGIAYYQNSKNEYMVSFVEAEDDPSPITTVDKLLSSAIVVNITGLRDSIVQGIDLDSFFKIDIPVDDNQIGEDADLGDLIQGDSEINLNAPKLITLYLKVEDIINSPTPNSIYIDVVRYELIDYGYYY